MEITSRTIVGEVSFQDIAVALNRGERVAIIVRHAERPPLEKNDPTFGKDLELTEHGIEQAKTFGFVLSQFIGTATHAVYAGDNKRCTMTAKSANSGNSRYGSTSRQYCRDDG